MTAKEAIKRAIWAVNGFYSHRPALKGEIVEALQTLVNRINVNVEIYDEEEIHENCTVQVWKNSHTGAVSVGWWKND